MYRRKNIPVVGLVYAREITCAGWGSGRRKWKPAGRSRRGGHFKINKRKDAVLLIIGGLAMGICLFFAGFGLAAAAGRGNQNMDSDVSASINQDIEQEDYLDAAAVGDNDGSHEGNPTAEMAGVPELNGDLESTGTQEHNTGLDSNLTEEDDTILVAIDPGHGGVDEGCSGSIAYEKDINLSIALQVRSLLLESGYQVLLTREDDSVISLEERVQMAQAAGADAYISIHQNACENSGEVNGIETWCRKEDSLRLTRLVQKYTVSSTEARDRGAEEDGDLEEYQLKIAKGIVKGIDLFFHPRTMYLTFDDGPSAENTDAVLDILAEKNVKATFFVIGENVKKNPEVARRIVSEGHTIGIHCNTHAYDVIYESVDSYLEDFEAARSIVYEVTGVEPVLFRFPGGSINAYNKEVYEEIIQEMTERGYIYFDWNASLEDAVKKSTPEQLIKNATESTLGRKKVVMLAHDIVYNTTLCLEELIDQLPEYRMEALTEEVEPIQFKRIK